MPSHCASRRRRRPLSTLQWEQVRRLERLVTAVGKETILNVSLHSSTDPFLSSSENMAAFQSQASSQSSQTGSLGFAPDRLVCNLQRHLGVCARAAFVVPDVLGAGSTRSPCERWLKFQGTRHEAACSRSFWRRSSWEFEKLRGRPDRGSREKPVDWLRIDCSTAPQCNFLGTIDGGPVFAPSREIVLNRQRQTVTLKSDAWHAVWMPVTWLAIRLGYGRPCCRGFCVGRP